MGHGVKYLIITTDPVELWAAPTSDSRIERQFFDTNFEPFYRIEQVSYCQTHYQNSIKITFIRLISVGYHQIQFAALQLYNNRWGR